MSDAQPSPELPMDEILAAIRGTITANNGSSGPSAEPRPAIARADPESSDRLAPSPLPAQGKTPDREVRFGAGDRTLEDIVCDLLRPLLQTWLDENLPQIAERLVLAEITRIAGRYGRP